MGTRSITAFYDDDGRHIGGFYRQYDGYPTSHGAELKAATHGGAARILNGYGNHQIPQHFNTIGCLGAYLIGHFKKAQIGGIYLVPNDPLTNPQDQEDYTYCLSPGEDAITDGSRPILLRVYARNEIIYHGFLQDFDPEAAENVA